MEKNKALIAAWKLDHTICMNANKGNLEFNIDKEEDYGGEGYDPDDTDCKSINEACECLSIILDAVAEHKYKQPKEGSLQDKYNRLLDFVDVPTKIHLNEFKHTEGLKEYRQLRTELEDNLIVMDLIRKDPSELCFVLASKTYQDYVKTYTDVGGSVTEVVYDKEEFRILKEYFGEEDEKNN